MNRSKDYSWTRTTAASRTTRGIALASFLLVTLVTLVILVAASAGAETWEVDTSHTTVGFSVSHLFTSVQGRFGSFEGSVEFDPAKPEATVVRGTVQAASIDTDNEKRDKHLRSPDFFDVEKYPTLEFVSSGVSDWSKNGGKLNGKLTIHGVTRDVSFDAKFLGRGTDPWGNVKAGFRATLTINRKDYGLDWNQILEAGGVLVGEEIEIRIDVEANLQDG